MTYFNNCNKLDELKAEYRRLTLKYHPDVGGDVEIMKEINVEYEIRFEALRRVMLLRWFNPPRSMVVLNKCLKIGMKRRFACGLI